MRKLAERLLFTAGISLCLAGAMWSTQDRPAAAASTSNLRVITIGGDYFHNYDFLSRGATGSNVDWPVTVFFKGNATVDNAKDRLTRWSNNFEFASWTSMYMSMRDSSTASYTWDDDGGRKTPFCPVSGDSSPHARIYGIGTYERLYNTTLGYWVPATTHRDYNECPPVGTRYAQSEQIEDLLINDVDEDTAVQRDYWNIYNNEPLRDEGSHRWENNGYASTLNVP